MTVETAHRARSFWRRVARPFYREFEDILIVRDLGGERRRTSGRLNLEPMRPGLAGLLADVGRRGDDPALRRRMEGYSAHGYHGVAAMHSDKVAGYLWWVDRQIDPAVNHPHLHRLRIRLGEADLYMFDLLIAPEHRGRGFASELLDGFHACVYQQGYRRVWASVRATNVIARSLYAAAGYHECRVFRGRCLLGRLLIMDGRLFVRNGRRQPCRFDWREIFPRRRPAEQRPEESEASGGQAPAVAPSSRP